MPALLVFVANIKGICLEGFLPSLTLSEAFHDASSYLGQGAIPMILNDGTRLGKIFRSCYVSDYDELAGPSR